MIDSQIQSGKSALKNHLFSHLKEKAEEEPEKQNGIETVSRHALACNRHGCIFQKAVGRRKMKFKGLAS